MKKTLTMAGLVAGSLLIAGTAFASFSDEAKVAIENNDFSSFQTAVEGTRGERVTEEKFERIVERHADRSERHDAIEAGDYDAFVALLPEDKEAPSEEVFVLLGDLHEAKDAEDEDKIDEIKAELKELGFEKKGKRGHKGGRGFGSRTE